MTNTWKNTATAAIVGLTVTLSANAFSQGAPEGPQRGRQGWGGGEGQVERPGPGGRFGAGQGFGLQQGRGRAAAEGYGQRQGQGYGPAQGLRRGPGGPAERGQGLGAPDECPLGKVGEERRGPGAGPGGPRHGGMGMGNRQGDGLGPAQGMRRGGGGPEAMGPREDRQMRMRLRNPETHLAK